MSRSARTLPRHAGLKRRFRSRLARMAAALLLGTLGAAAAALQITDDSGVTVHFDAPPQRVLSAVPALTETVCALGACDRLVGVDRYSNWPAEVRRLPQVGGGIDPSLEAIVALKPDVVLMSPAARGVERLRALGLKVVTLESRTGADTRRVIGALGRMLAVPQADRVARDIEAGVVAAAESLPPALHGLRVYFEASAGPHAAGPQSFIGELMGRLGLVNIIGPELGPFPRINPELVVRADPDLIMAGARGAAEIARRPGWDRLAAVQGGRMCVFSLDEMDVLVRPGPRMAEAARLMARCVISHGGRGAAR